MNLIGIGKEIVKVMFAAVILVLFGSILDIKIEEWVTISIPKPSVKIEEKEKQPVVETVYIFDGDTVSQDVFFKWDEDEYRKLKALALKKASKNDSRLKFTGSGRTRSTANGEINYGTGR